MCNKFTRASGDIDKYCDANLYEIEEEKIILAGDFLLLLPTVPGSLCLGIWTLISIGWNSERKCHIQNVLTLSSLRALRFSSIFPWIVWIWQLLETRLVMDSSLYPMWQFIFPKGTKLTLQLLKVDAVVVSGIETKLSCHSALRGGSFQHGDVGKCWQPPPEPGLERCCAGWCHHNLFRPNTWKFIYFSFHNPQPWFSVWFSSIYFVYLRQRWCLCEDLVWGLWADFCGK